MLLCLARPAALFLVVALAACGPTAQQNADAGAEADTVPAVQPVTPAEIERRAEPMTPEEAAERGVVDTTIHVTDEP
jgi:hypothetical protein